MTVMLLQRSATPQLTHSQKTADNNNSNEPPFLILLDIQEHAELDRATGGYEQLNLHHHHHNNNNNINNNNSVNNNAHGEKSDHKNVAVIGRGSTCGSGIHLYIRIFLELSLYLSLSLSPVCTPSYRHSLAKFQNSAGPTY